jgi:hypothetical protein
MEKKKVKEWERYDVYTDISIIRMGRVEKKKGWVFPTFF